MRSCLPLNPFAYFTSTSSTMTSTCSIALKLASVVERPIPECHQRGLHWLRCRHRDPYALSTRAYVTQHCTSSSTRFSRCGRSRKRTSTHSPRLLVARTRRDRARSGVGAHPPVLQQRLELERVRLPHAATLPRVLPARQPHARHRLLLNNGHCRHDGQCFR